MCDACVGWLRRQGVYGAPLAPPEATQATRAARFWDELYTAAAAPSAGPGATAAAAGTPGARTASSTVAHDEWILPAEDVLPHLPAALPRGARVLELGCGVSSLGACVAISQPGAAVLGVDISPAAVAESIRRNSAAAQPLGNLAFAVADVTALGASLCPDGAFALVLDKGTSDTLAYRGRRADTKALLAAMFAEVERVLAPGGLYVIATPRRTVRQLRSVAWASVRSTEVAILGGGGLGGAARGTVWVHVCTKCDGTPAPPVVVRDLETACSGCGIARYPRYRTAAAWTKHARFCSGAPAPAELLLRVT